MSFVFGLAVNELQFLAFAWLLAATALLFAQGDADSPGAWVALSIAALTTAALTVILTRAMRARPVVTDALHIGPGQEWQTTA